MSRVTRSLCSSRASCFDSLFVW